MRIHRHHSRADIAKDHVRLEPDPLELGFEGMGLEPRRPKSMAQNRDHREHEVEDEHLRPERGIGAAGPDHVDREHPGRRDGHRDPEADRHDHGVRGDQQHVERRGCAARRSQEPGEERDQPKIDDELRGEEGGPRLPQRIPQLPRPVSGDDEREDDRDAGDERQLRKAGPDQRTRDQRRERDDQSPTEEPGEERPLIGKRSLAWPVGCWHGRNISTVPEGGQSGTMQFRPWDRPAARAPRAVPA